MNGSAADVGSPAYEEDFMSGISGTAGARAVMAAGGMAGTGGMKCVMVGAPLWLG